MLEIAKTDELNALVDYFLQQGNFDHPDMEEIARIGGQFGVSEIDAAKAFFVAREKSSLAEAESLDGGDGLEAFNTKNYGDNSLHEMLFENSSRGRKKNS